MFELEALKGGGAGQSRGGGGGGGGANAGGTPAPSARETPVRSSARKGTSARTVRFQAHARARVKRTPARAEASRSPLGGCRQRRRRRGAA